MSSEGESSAEEIHVEISEALCHICRTDFTLTRRRHHCRVCNKPVCGNCSSGTVPGEKSLLPSSPQGGRIRACDRCFEIRRFMQTAGVEEALAAQEGIVTSLKTALKENFKVAEKSKDIILAVIKDLSRGDLPPETKDHDSILQLCDMVERLWDNLEISTTNLAKDVASERLERLEKERGVELLGERANRAETALGKLREAERKRADLKSKVECQLFVMESLRDRIQFLERPAYQRSLSAPQSPLLGSTSSRVCYKLKRCFGFYS